MYIKNELKTMKVEHEVCRNKTTKFFKECLPNEPNCVPAIPLKTVWTALLILAFGILFAAVAGLLEWMEYYGYMFKCKTYKHNSSNNHSSGRWIILTIYAIIFTLFTGLVVAFLFYFLAKGKITFGKLDVLNTT